MMVINTDPWAILSGQLRANLMMPLCVRCPCVWGRMAGIQG